MKTLKIFLAVSLMSISIISPSYGKIIFLNTAPTDYWMCKARDLDNRVFTADSQYQKSAIVQALSECKRQSPYPASCEALNEDCDGILSGSIKRTIWRCTSLDSLANYWYSSIASNDIEAALSAKAICRAESSVPETCYVNMITCENLNKNFIDLLNQNSF